MPRRTVPHPRCQPFVNRHLGKIYIIMPVLRPDGEYDHLKREITPRQAFYIASELMAGLAGRIEPELGQIVASEPS